MCETGPETLQQALSDQSPFQFICICVVVAGLFCVTTHEQAGLESHVRA